MFNLKSRRSIAFFVSILFLLAIVLSAAFIVHNSHHVCSRHNCSTCLLLDVCADLISMTAAIFVLFTGFSGTVRIDLSIVNSCGEYLARISPTTLKVKLLN